METTNKNVLKVGADVRLSKDDIIDYLVEDALVPIKKQAAEAEAEYIKAQDLRDASSATFKRLVDAMVNSEIKKLNDKTDAIDESYFEALGIKPGLKAFAYDMHHDYENHFTSITFAFNANGGGPFTIRKKPLDLKWSDELVTAYNNKVSFEHQCSQSECKWNTLLRSCSTVAALNLRSEFKRKLVAKAISSLNGGLQKLLGNGGGDGGDEGKENDASSKS